jgi:hypothetical protein
MGICRAWLNVVGPQSIQVEAVTIEDAGGYMASARGDIVNRESTMEMSRLLARLLPDRLVLVKSTIWVYLVPSFLFLPLHRPYIDRSKGLLSSLVIKFYDSFGRATPGRCEHQKYGIRPTTFTLSFWTLKSIRYAGPRNDTRNPESIWSGRQTQKDR